MHARKKVGFVAGALALLLLAALAIHALTTDAMSPGLLVLCLADTMLWMLALRLAGDASAHVTGVRETVDRLASVLQDTRR